jgi:hypothetical protein
LWCHLYGCQAHPYQFLPRLFGIALCHPSWILCYRKCIDLLVHLIISVCV